jgi:putative tricarboxylic transport membrane protein
MDIWIQGFQAALSGSNPLMLLLGTVVGLVVGVLPAVGPSFGVTLALPFTYGLDPAAAMILLCAIQASCAYGDSIASILVNVPGGPGTVATMWEGYPLTRKGKAGTALGIATGASFAGGIIGWLSFVVLAKPMTDFAMVIGGPEYFVLGVMALALISLASKGETIKGVVMACLGLLLGMIGADPVSGITYRFGFGLAPLEAGIETVLGALAIFAVPQFVEMLQEGGTIAQVAQIKDSVIGGIGEVLKRPWSILRGGTIGWLIGVMPALGTSAAGITAYLVEKKFSKEKDMFGKGSMDGLTAAEVGKGACVLGDGITSLMLGVPGSVTWAILMAALIIHGVQPGPRFMTSGVLPYTVFAGLLLGQACYFILGILFVKQMARIVYVPNQILAPVVAILCFVGAFVAKNYVYDIWIMVGLGAFAFVANRSGYPTVPMILGFILAPLIENNFHQALGVGYGSALIFFERPISLALVIITVVFLAWPWLSVWIRDRFMKPAAKAAPVAGAEETISFADVLVEEDKPADNSEIFMSVVVFALLAIFLTTSMTYAPSVRLFPVIVSVVGIVIVVYRFLVTVRGHKITLPKFTEVFAGSEGGMPWWMTMGLLVLYALAVPFLGMLIASVLWFGAVCYLSGYYRRPGAWRAIAITLVLIFVVLFGSESLLRMNLPVGVFGI